MKKTPVQCAIDCYGDKLESLLAWYSDHGYIYIGPDLFILACLHNKDYLLEESKEDLSNLNAWYVQFVAGDMARAIELCPKDVEWVVFERKATVRKKAYKLSEIKKMVNRYGKRPSTPGN